MGLSACTASIHQVHVVTLILLKFALLLLLSLHALIHLICDVQWYFFVGPWMCVEKLVGLLRTKKEDPVLKILFLKLGHLLIHDECLCKVLKLALALALDFCVYLDEDL